MRGVSREALGLFISGVSGLAFLIGLMPLVRVPVVIGLLFWIAAVGGAIFFIVAAIRAKNNLAFALLELLLVGGFCFICLYGVMWYFLVYLPNSGQPFLGSPFPVTTRTP